MLKLRMGQAGNQKMANYHKIRTFFTYLSPYALENHYLVPLLTFGHGMCVYAGSIRQLTISYMEFFNVTWYLIDGLIRSCALFILKLFKKRKLTFLGHAI